MPESRMYMGGGYYDGKIYVVGGMMGHISDYVSAQTWAYDIAADSWSTLASMPDARAAATNASASLTE